VNVRGGMMQSQFPDARHTRLMVNDCDSSSSTVSPLNAAEAFLPNTAKTTNHLARLRGMDIEPSMEHHHGT